MGNMIQANVKIRGTRPMLWHRFGPDALPLEKKEKVGVAGNNPEEWKDTVLFTREGQLYIEPTYIFGCLRDASKHTKRGRGSIMKYVQATLQVLDSRVLIDRFIPGVKDGKLPDQLTTDPDEEVYLDVRGVKNPGTGARNVRYRVAANHGWQTEFNIAWDATIVSRGEMEAVIIDGSKLCGLGDGRSIGFGRFEVEEFYIVE